MEDDSTRIFMARVEQGRQEKKPQPVEQVVLCSDGVEVPVEIMSETVDFGGILTLRSTFRDVTERKKMRERNAAMLKTCTDGFWLPDARGQFLEINVACGRISGYSRDELLTTDLRDLEAGHFVNYCRDGWTNVGGRALASVRY
jgi:PAS domain-containing protein